MNTERVANLSADLTNDVSANVFADGKIVDGCQYNIRQSVTYKNVSKSSGFF